MQFLIITLLIELTYLISVPHNHHHDEHEDKLENETETLIKLLKPKNASTFL